MRIALIIYGSLAQQTGGYLYDRMLVRELRASGAEVEVFSQPWGHYGVRFARGFVSRIVGRLARGGFDVVLQDELNHPSLVGVNLRSRRRIGVPSVAIVHNLSAEGLSSAVWRPAVARVERRYLRTVDGLIVNSLHTRRSVERLVGELPPVVLAYPGADHLQPADPDPGRGQGPLRLLFVGNLSPVKGLHTLLEALARLRGLPWRLDVVGSLDRDPRYVGRIRSAIEGLGMASQVTLRGALEGEALRRAYAVAEVLVLTSPQEGFGIVYLEAMQAALPVVASSGGAAPEIVTDGVEGFLVDPTDPRAIAEALTRFMEDRSLAERMGQWAKRRGASHPSWRDTAQLVRAFLATLPPRRRWR